MDFLKSAVASAISKGPPFPYTFGDKIDVEQSIWTLHNGTKREDSSNCSIFSFDVVANRSRLPLARNALKKLRTLRHPGVIKVLDTVETDAYIYIATERVMPLRWHIRRKSLSPETIKWGLHSIASTVKFINNEASSIHGNVKAASIYTSESGEWRLGGFDVLSSVKDDEAIIYTYGSLVPDSGRYAPPELSRGGWDVIKRNPHAAVDAFNYGVLIFEAFNGDYTGADQAGQTKGIPPNMHASYRRLVNANPKARLTVGHFFEQGQRRGAFFDTPLIKLSEGVDNLGVKTAEERDAFLSDLDQLTGDFPEDFFKMKILPELLKSLEFGGGGPQALSVIMKISKQLSDDDFNAKVTPVVVRLFANPDRAIRVALLDSLDSMIDRLSQKIVNDKIFPHLVTGFGDLAPVVREQTLKSVLIIITKLSDRTINGELLRHLAKTANDEQPGIRTNTTICLGKIAKHLGTSSRSKVLIAAFLRSLRDPFVHARNAALMALSATSDFFSDEDCATRILPALCPLVMDKEKPVREQANKTLDLFLLKIRKAAAGMPDSVLPPQQGQSGENAGAPRMGTPQPAGEAAASGWAGWAISSFTNKIGPAAGEMQTGANASANGSRPGGVSPSPEAKKAVGGLPASASASTLHRQAVSSPQSRSATPAAPATPVEDYFAQDEELDDGWGDMNDDGFFDDESQGQEKTLEKSSIPERAAKKMSSASATTASTPYGDDGEPDFASWLNAKAQKSTSTGGKPLPKGLAKSSSAGTVKKSMVAKPAAKKVDLKPKEADEDDGWGDAW